MKISPVHLFLLNLCMYIYTHTCLSIKILLNIYIFHQLCFSKFKSETIIFYLALTSEWLQGSVSRPKIGGKFVHFFLYLFQWVFLMQAYASLVAFIIQRVSSNKSLISVSSSFSVSSVFFLPRDKSGSKSSTCVLSQVHGFNMKHRSR